MSGIILELLSLYDQPSYLEIGVQEGFSFHRATASRKIAVDPKFMFDVDKAQLDNPEASYFECTSDEFFARYSGPAFDVVYIDGLHTAEQTLRDLLNTLAVITPRSIIVVDDIGPNSYAASLPSMDAMWEVKRALNDPDASWMGDVYKLVYFIEAFMQQYSFASPIGGNPQLVLWREARAVVGQRSLLDIASMNFLEHIRAMNTKNPKSVEEIISAIKAAIKVV